MQRLEELQENDFDVVVFDSDGVTIRKGTELKETEKSLEIQTNVIEPKMVEALNELKKHCIVAISSGRSLMHLLKAYEPVIDERVVLQAENGIITMVDGVMRQNLYFLPDEMRKIRDMKKRIRGIENQAIKGFEPKTFLITVHCENRVDEIEEIVDEYEGFSWLWNGEAYDIQLDEIDKGFSLNQFEGKKIVAVGNGENDLPMLNKADIGITTDADSIQSDFCTSEPLEDGGLEVINHLLKLKGDE